MQLPSTSISILYPSIAPEMKVAFAPLMQAIIALWTGHNNGFEFQRIQQITPTICKRS